MARRNSHMLNYICVAHVWMHAMHFMQQEPVRRDVWCDDFGRTSSLSYAVRLQESISFRGFNFPFASNNRLLAYTLQYGTLCPAAVHPLKSTAGPGVCSCTGHPKHCPQVAFLGKSDTRFENPRLHLGTICDELRNSLLATTKFEVDPFAPAIS